MTCKAGATKNRKAACQYIQPELAARLKDHITTKAPKAPVFSLPHESNLARMLRDDLAEARKQWLAEVTDDPQEYAQRQQSDFLTDTNHEGEVIDFHSLRHTCGAWLAMTGVYPKVVQQVMRHQSITLTMDTYGHLFPGQEADCGKCWPTTHPPRRPAGNRNGQSNGERRAAAGAAVRTRNNANGCEAVRRGKR